MARTLMNSGQAAEYLNIRHRALYKMIERSELPVARVRGSLLLSPVALDAWATKQRVVRVGA